MGSAREPEVATTTAAQEIKEFLPRIRKSRNLAEETEKFLEHLAEAISSPTTTAPSELTRAIALVARASGVGGADDVAPDKAMKMSEVLQIVATGLNSLKEDMRRFAETLEITDVDTLNALFDCIKEKIEEKWEKYEEEIASKERGATNKVEKEINEALEEIAVVIDLEVLSAPDASLRRKLEACREYLGTNSGGFSADGLADRIRASRR